VPPVDDVAPRLEPLLLWVEAPIDAELPGLVEDAVAPVALVEEVLLPVLALHAEALLVEEAERTSLAFAVSVADEVFVAESLLLALFDAESFLVDEALLLALACWAAFLVELELLVALSVVVRLFVLLALLLFELLELRLSVAEELLVVVEFCEVVLSVVLFWPRV
jgi:hypothetical protein